MIRALVGRIVSVIRRQDQQIILTQYRKQFSKFPVKLLDLLPVSDRISAVSPQRIKIDQIRKTKSLKIAFCNIDGLLHTVHAAVRMIALCDTFTDKDVIDLSNRDHIVSGIF